MSNKLRDDKECENCGYTVERAYCSNCGQKNTETRQSFGHLFAHFVEDLTHYDGAFWKTIKYLMFRPGTLTKEYLSGKRSTYVPPVKLYIFISFVTFFMLSLIVSTAVSEDEHVRTEKKDVGPIEINGKLYNSVEDLEAQERAKSPEERMGSVEHWIVKKTIIASKNNVTVSTFIQGLLHTTPKVLFIYMPVFAFWLWLFHGKKRWYFFDHGIFTLHYFSFLLLLISVVTLLNWILGFVPINPNVLELLTSIIAIAVLGYSFFYFFRAHSRIYGEKKWMSRLKSIILFVINAMVIVFVVAAMVFYIAINAH
jgi:hypothetical protein